jgi:hypothetical protein
MCLEVWVGARSPLAERARVAPGGAPDSVEGYHYVEHVADGAPIRACFESPFVSYVGSNEGCGCGYNSQELAFQGVRDSAEALAMLDAMSADERERFLAAQRSRVRLRGIVECALREGPVEIYGCWSGDDDAAPLHPSSSAPGHWALGGRAPARGSE